MIGSGNCGGASAFGSGEVINSKWLTAHYPPYWHYDVPQALLVLARMGKLGDPRAAEAIDLVLDNRREDELWHAGPSWWKPPGRGGSNVEVVDWGRGGPSEMVTLNALRILRAAGYRLRGAGATARS